jgi:hypothetical protein
MHGTHTFRIHQFEQDTETCVSNPSLLVLYRDRTSRVQLLCEVMAFHLSAIYRLVRHKHRSERRISFVVVEYKILTMLAAPAHHNTPPPAYDMGTPAPSYAVDTPSPY